MYQIIVEGRVYKTVRWESAARGCVRALADWGRVGYVVKLPEKQEKKAC